MKKAVIIVLVCLFVVLPFVFAETNDQTQSSCGIFNMLQCLRDAAYLLTAGTGMAAEPFLQAMATMMTMPAYTHPFKNVWWAMTGIISTFYIFFLLHAGVIFLTQGDNITQRHAAKESIQHMVIALILVAASFYLYTLITDLNASLTSYLFLQVDPNFFNVTSTSFGNALVQIFLIIPYILLIMITLDLLFLRWLLISIGVILFPIGIFLYFVPFLRNYGRLIIHLLMALIFLPFLITIIILGASTLVNTPPFTHLSIIFMTVTFLLIDFLFFVMVKFVLHHAAGNQAISYARFVHATGKRVLMEETSKRRS